MAHWSIRSRSALAEFSILAPERYDPRRAAAEGERGALRIADVASSVRDIVTPERPDRRTYVVVDTTNARESILHNSRAAVGIETVGSAKKVARNGDVLISRLRTYLRQVALVDPQLPGVTADGVVACSTEYFVLRSLTGESIAFLVPLLLSARVQEILAAAQEGGHHPRVSEETILNLPVPAEYYASRAKISEAVEVGIAGFRACETQLLSAIATASASFPQPSLQAD